MRPTCSETVSAPPIVVKETAEALILQRPNADRESSARDQHPYAGVPKAIHDTPHAPRSAALLR